MSEDQHDAYTVALQQLHAAVRLYTEGQDYYSAITVGGAAEELLGRLLMKEGRKTALEDLKEAEVEIMAIIDPGAAQGGPQAGEFARRANHARNLLKHWGDDVSQPEAFDAAEEARDMIDRAISNHMLLTGNITPEMTCFVREHLFQHPGEEAQ